MRLDGVRVRAVALSPPAVCTSSSCRRQRCPGRFPTCFSCTSACPEFKPSVCAQKGQVTSACGQHHLDYLSHLKAESGSLRRSHLDPRGLPEPRSPSEGSRGGSCPAQPPPHRDLSHTLSAWVEALWGVDVSPHGQRAGAGGLTAFVFSAQASRASHRAASLTTARPGRTITRSRVSEPAF